MQKTLTISNYYQEDHVRLDDLFQRFQENKRVDFNDAYKCFLEFEFGLQRHMAWEEEILFPFFEVKTSGALIQPVTIMKIEHRRIATLLQLIHNRLREGDPHTDLEKAELMTFLKNHNQKEEEILYPKMDDAATEEEIESIFKTMYSLPLDKYELC